MPTISIKTIKPGGGGDYTSLSAWEAAEQANLVSGDLIKVAECYPGVDALQCTLSGWTTDATHYIWIRGAQRTVPSDVGVPVFRMRAAAALTTGMLRNLNFGGTQYVIIERIAVRSRNAACDAIRQNDFSGQWVVKECYMDTTVFGASDGGHGLNFFGNGSLRAWNNVVFGFSSAGIPANATGGIHVQGAGATAYIYANTIIDCYNGIWGEAGTRAVNNIVADHSGFTIGNPFVTAGGFHADCGYNAVETAVAPGINNSVGPIVFVGTLSVTFDWHLDLSDLTARRKGADLSAGPVPIVDDMEGTPRGEVWDIGADQTITEEGGLQDTIRVFTRTGSIFRWKGADQVSLLGPGGFGGGGGEGTGVPK